MNLSLFTLIHILISLAGILSGLLVTGTWIAGKRFPKLTAFFLITTALTSITGFFFPLKGLTPAVIFGILSLVVLAVAAGALLTGKAPRTFVICSVTALYLNFFVLVAQLFQKTPALRELAPTQAEPPFGISQSLVLGTFIALGIGAVRGTRKE